MKLLVFADLHLDTTFRWLKNKPEIARELRNRLRRTLTDIIKLAQEKQVDAVLCAGDLYEQEHFTPDTARFVSSTLNEAGPIRIYLAPGNHDWLAPDSIYQTTSWGSYVHLFTENRFCPVELETGLLLWGYAHTRPTQTVNPLEGFRVKGEGTHIGLFHGSENRLSTRLMYESNSYAPFDSEDINRAGLAHAFVGHYHNPIDETLFTYPGNPHPLNFGEGQSSQRGPILVEIDSKGIISRERIDVASTIFRDVSIDVTGAESSQDVRDIVSHELHRLKNGIVRVFLTGDISPEIDLHITDLNGVGGHLDVCTFRLDRLRVAYDIEKIKQESTVRGTFCQQVLSSDLEEEEKHRILVTGLRALEGRTDLDLVSHREV